MKEDKCLGSCSFGLHGERNRRAFDNNEGDDQTFKQ